MATEKEQIEVLRKLLAEAEERAKKAEARAKAAEKQAAEAMKLALERMLLTADGTTVCLEGALTILSALVKSVEDMKDLPEADADRFDEVLRIVHELQDRCTLLNTLAPFLKALARKSERLGAKKAQPKAPDKKTLQEQKAELEKTQKQIASAVNKAQRLRRTIEDVQKTLRPQIDGVAEAVTTAAQEDGDAASSVIKAGAAIAAQAVPEAAQKAPLPNDKQTLGRQKVVLPEDMLSKQAPRAEAFVCPQCGSTHGDDIGSFDVRVRKLIYDLQSLADAAISGHRIMECHQCGRHHLMVPENEPVPVTPQATIGQDLTLAAAHMTYCGVPVHRTERILQLHRLQMGNSTLGDNMLRWVTQYGSPLLKEMLKVIHKAEVIAVDETPFSILQLAGKSKVSVQSLSKQGYVLITSSVANAPKPFCLYQRLDGRGGKEIRRKLDGFKPKAYVTDGYQPYESMETKTLLENAAHQSCLVHLRRTILDAFSLSTVKKRMELAANPQAFEEIKKQLRSGSPEYVLALVIEGFSKIYAHEKALKPLEGESREDFLKRVAASRKANAEPLMDNIDVLMESLKEQAAVYDESTKQYVAKSQGSSLHKAVVYYFNRRDQLRVFLTNPQVPPDSNTAERCVRAVAVLEGVCKFKQSPEYMDALCVYFTLFATAEACGISNPMKWLEEYGRAYYIHRADRTLDYLVSEGLLSRKLCNFTKESAQDFPVEDWLPWTYAARQKKED